MLRSSWCLLATAAKGKRGKPAAAAKRKSAAPSSSTATKSPNATLTKKSPKPTAASAQAKRTTTTPPTASAAATASLTPPVTADGAIVAPVFVSPASQAIVRDGGASAHGGRTPSEFTQPIERRSLVSILDGHAMMYRAYHSFCNSVAKVEERTPEAARRWMRKSINAYIATGLGLKPPGREGIAYETREMCVCLDGGAWARTDALPAYKSNRATLHTPESDAFVAAGCAAFRELVIPTVTVVPKSRGAFAAEADDLIFTLAMRAARTGRTDTVVMSHDKDLMQLIDTSPAGRRYYFNIRDRVFYDEAKVLEKVGVRPDQILDYLALLGDAADCIPGIPGAGKLRAARLLKQHDTLDKIYAAAVAAKGESLGKYLPAELTAAIVRGYPEACRMRRDVIALRDVPEPFEEAKFLFEQHA